MIDTRRDFTANWRLLGMAAIAAPIGFVSTVAAFGLLALIRLFTNVFFFQTFSFANHSPALNHLGLWVIPIPVVGGLLIGLMARFGSEQIRGHGIPEAIEAILFGQSRMSPKVALLKPLSSGIAIGSGGPFGAEGPIIMTGGAIGSLIGQQLRISGAERKALLVAGATAGMTAIFGTPLAAVMLAVELLLFELRPRSLLPVAIACAVAGFTRPYFFAAGPLFPLQTSAVTSTVLLPCFLAGLRAAACHGCSRHRSTKSRISLAHCRSTGCGGRPSAPSRWASAAICSLARSELDTMSSATCCRIIWYSAWRSACFCAKPRCG